MNIFYIVLAVAVLILLICLIFFLKDKLPFLSKLLATLCIIAFVGASAYCCMEVVRYVTAEGGVYGQITGIFDTNQVVTDNMAFSFKNIEMKEVDGNLYRAETSTPDLFQLKENKTYSLFVNNVDCFDITQGQDFITGKFTYNFYDSKLNVIESDTLDIKFSFYEKYSYICIETNGGEKAVKYWNYYFNKNDFVVKISDTFYRPQEEPTPGEDEKPTYCTITFNVNGEEYSQVVEKGKRIQDLTTPKVKFYQFKGWSLDNNVIENPMTKIGEDTTLYAIFDQEAGFYDQETGLLSMTWEDVIKEKWITVSNSAITDSMYVDAAFPGEYKNPKVLVIDDSVTLIGEYAFSLCHWLSQIFIPKSVTEIGKRAFEDCANLTQVHIAEGLRVIQENAFCENSELEIINLPESLTSIKSNAFQSCTKLTTITIPKNAVCGYGVFADCSMLKEAEFENGATIVASGMFKNCSNLSNVILPSSIKQISTNAFYRCIALKSIYIPANVVMDNPYNDPDLYNVQYYKEHPEEVSVFYECLKDLIIYCGDAFDKGQENEVWNNYSKTQKLQVKYGYTYEQYINEIGG